MSTSLRESPARPRARGRRPSNAERDVETPTTQHSRRVLVAVDGSRAANAALRFARRLAERGDWRPEVVTVAEPMPEFVGENILPVSPFLQQVIRDNVMLSLKAQVKRHGLVAWPASVHLGSPAPTIVDVAKDGASKMIVMGLGRHGRLAQLTGADTVARVARHVDRPVLAVHPSTRRLPRRAVVATDFGASAARAAREALALLERPAHLHLVHVQVPVTVASLIGADWTRAYSEAVEKNFARLVAELGATPDVTVTTEVRYGIAAEEVAKYAADVGADLIAAGSHVRPLVERMLIGSTPTGLLRAAHCSVLVVPSTHGSSPGS